MERSERQAEDEAFRALVRTHARPVRSVIERHEKNRMEVDEISADVFALAHDHMSELAQASPGQARSWLLRTARFLTANKVRRSMARRRLEERLQREPLSLAAAPDDELAAWDEEAAAQRESECICVVLNGLRADFRQALVMAALGHSGAEIAVALGVSPSAGRKRLMRARSAFREAYESANVASHGEDDAQ